MMKSQIGNRIAALVLVAAILPACSALGTSVAEDDPETEVPNTSMGRAIMEGLGAVPARRQALNYTPRAPLVVPPSTSTLVTPEPANKVATLAGWPDDNDLARARALREAQARNDALDDNGRVPSNELAAGALPNEHRQRVVTPGVERRLDKPLLPSQIGKMQSSPLDGTSIYAPDGTPRRQALVEPPVAYLQPAPGVPVTTETIEDASKVTPPFWQRLKFW